MQPVARRQAVNAVDGEESDRVCVAVGMVLRQLHFSAPMSVRFCHVGGTTASVCTRMKPCERLSCLRVWPPQLAWQRRHTPIPAPTRASWLRSTREASSYHSGPEAVVAAKQVCDWINQGQPRSDVIKSVSAGNPGFTMYGAAEFTTFAERAYCPQHPGEPAAQQQPSPPPPSWYQIQIPLPTFG